MTLAQFPQSFRVRVDECAQLELLGGLKAKPLLGAHHPLRQVGHGRFRIGQRGSHAGNQRARRAPAKNRADASGHQAEQAARLPRAPHNETFGFTNKGKS